MAGRRKSASRSRGPEFLAFDQVGLRLANSVVFGRTNWTWRQGEQWAILGPDGSGKSVLVNALLGRAPLAAGELRGPHGPADAPELAPEEAIALVSPESQRQLAVREATFYQSRWHSGLREGQRTVSQFLSQESVEDHNPFEVNPSHGDRQLFQDRRRQYIRWLGIRCLLRRRIAHLSTGELRKTLLVRALLHAPRLLILEDPYAGLDAPARRGLECVVARLMQTGWPVLLVTHQVEEIPSPTTHLLLVGQHRVLTQGPKDEMLRLWRTRFGPRSTATGPSAFPARKRFPHLRSTRAGGHEPLVELRGVTIRGDCGPILKQVTWTVRKGECWVVLGPNGAGKTTLLNLIQGDHPQAYSQNIRLFGRSTESTQTLWEARQQLGWMSPELHQHYPNHWPILDVVVSGFFNTIGLYQTRTRRQRALALQWLHDLGLGREARAALGDLSFGEQRLVLLARAVVKQPRLLILDEPCQGLDAVQRWKLLAAVDRVVAQTDAGLLFVTHHPDECPRCITHVLRLAAGRVQGVGPLTRPNTELSVGLAATPPPAPAHRVDSTARRPQLGCPDRVLSGPRE
jgi:molybdate transport system ATP-binding protein